MQNKGLTPLSAVVRGAIAGAAGTAAMDFVWYNRYRRSGGQGSFKDFESSSDEHSFEKAGPPAEVARRVGEGFLQERIPSEKAGVLKTLVHWSYGSMWGAAYGIAAGSAAKARPSYGLLLGPIVWGTAYVFLPKAKLYEPIYKYDAKTLAKDLSAHLAYGAGTGIAFRALTSNRRSTKAVDRLVAQRQRRQHAAAKPEPVKARATKVKGDHRQRPGSKDLGKVLAEAKGRIKQAADDVEIAGKATKAKNRALKRSIASRPGKLKNIKLADRPLAKRS